MSLRVDKFCQAWRRGSLCLHPTDTLPGLSFNPKSKSALTALSRVKNRPQEKTCLALVADLPAALSHWQKLPEPWPKLLAHLWPAPLSVIWQASNKEDSLVHVDGTLALRVPKICSSNSWLIDVLNELGEPFPTTSVNRSGQKNARTWDEAVAFAKDLDIYVPDHQSQLINIETEPSTVISIDQSGSYAVVRSGAISDLTLAKEWQRYERS